jgi:hypothetical protein
MWAVTILELMETPAARELLAELAKGNGCKWLAREAGACLKRLEKSNSR